MDKGELRALAREARRAMTAEERAAAMHAVADLVLALPGVEEARTVLGYAATAEELDPAPVLEALRRGGARVALPRVTGPMRLTLHWVTASDELVAGAFYDNLLPTLLPVALKVGRAFDEQLVEAVPAEDHDVPLDFVVTPHAVFE